MISITNDKINLWAPNASAVKNAQKIVKSGGFLRLAKTADDTLLYGECAGSGANPYTTSADFIDPDNPVFRCTCPSRQFPCKHTLALLLEAMSGKAFETIETPQEILDKRAKQEKRKEAKKQPAASRRTNTAALAKKMQKQLQGLELAEQFVNDLLTAGLATLGGSSLATYRSLAKQMGDYYLPGPQAMINGILIGLERLQKHPEEENAYYTQVVDHLITLQNTIKKARVFLNSKVEDGASMEDSTLYQRIGYIWQLSQLDQLGLFQDHVELIQLSFSIYYDEARAEYIDTGYWINPQDGVISKKENLRPLKAAKHIRQDDSCFECLTIPRLYFYPGEQNKRVRWEGCDTRALTTDDFAAIRGWATQDLPTLVKLAKNQLKNVLSEKTVVCLIAYRQIGLSGSDCVLEDHSGHCIFLQNRPDYATDVIDRLHDLPDASLLENQVLTGEFFFDSANNRICVQPLSIITDAQIVRLLY
ncbi:MAG: SWIM zinc finger family protein [Anaerotruncus sp.]|nr:SWIM zinc finger family protein [Anaerotruncus sp.]